MKMKHRVLTLYPVLCALRRRVPLPFPPPLNFKACHKAHLALRCETDTKLGVRKHLESNSSPEGKSNGNSD